ncbi:site-specific integrase [Danxiaibacter flavus]|uniref:Site-specific integrase n=1 Tax=Danxiaibacter flavus TaxID=3049108 RepID=A0ABV3ZN20_9BACT|nr:site-specific integrase [Chitinophagaceae bacterium DXS]
MGVSIVPTIQRHRVDKSGKCSIILRVYFKGKTVLTENLGQKIDPQHWNEATKEVKKSCPNAILINALISKTVTEINSKILLSQFEDEAISKNTIKVLLRGADGSKDFIKYCREHIPQKYIGEKQAETKRIYLSEVNKLQEFQPEVYFADINYDFLSRYKIWMTSVRKNKENTVWKTFKWMNTMINDAVRMGGYIKKNPFSEFDRGKYIQGQRDFIDISECDKIYKILQTDIPDRLRIVGIYYLFMCYTGLRFQDATVFFNYDEHVVNDERIVIETQKFSTTVNLYMHDRLKTIVNYIKDNELKISNKDFNSYTKVLATLAGIKIDLTAHTGRHTFGATLAELGVPIERAQRLLGHKDKRSTEIYYHIKNKSLDADMQKWNQL